MTSFHQPEPTLEDFSLLLSAPSTNGNNNGKNGYSDRQSEPILDSESALSVNDDVNSREEISETKREMQPIISALTGLKSELKRAGLLEKPNVQNLFRQVAEHAAKQPKQPEQNDSLTSRYLRYQRGYLWEISAQMRQASNVETLLEIAVKSICDTMKADRVLVYCPSSENTGKVIAESLKRGWTPALGELLASTCFGCDRLDDYMTQQVVALDDTNRIEVSPYQRQLLEKLQVKASLSLPVVVAGQLWGLLVVQQCSKARSWKEAEINLLYQFSLELVASLQKSEFDLKLQQQSDQEKAVVKVIDRIRQSVDIETIFKTATQEVRQLLKADRVALFRFNDDWSGEFIAESVTTGWTRLVGPDIKTRLEDTYLQETQGGRYRNNETFSVNDIYTVGHQPYHIEILEQFEAKAYVIVIVPVFIGRKLWGLLAAYQNSGARQWESSEVSFLAQIGGQFGAALQLAESVKNAKLLEERKRVITNIADRIRQSMDITTILRTTTQEVRQLLKADRVAVYRFNEDWGGEFIAESVAAGWVKLVGPGIKTVWEDSHLQETQGGRYRNNETFAVDDIYTAGHYQCHIEMLEQFEVKAYTIVPVFTGDKLWGLLGAYQNSAPRHWDGSEVSLLAQIGAQLGLPVQQAELLSQIREQAERDKYVNRILDNIRKSLNITAILRTTTEDVRQLTNADRVAVYRFNPDWSGEFVAESVAEGWSMLVQRQLVETELKGKATDEPNCTIGGLIQGSAALTDTYLQDTSGGKYTKGSRVSQVDDIYKMNFSSCYLDLLQKFQARAYLIVPIFQGAKVWGLLACYQNSGPRRWLPAEATLLNQISLQLGIGLQQVELVAQTQQQADREKILVRVSERIRQSLDISRQSIDINSILKVTTQEIRQLLKTDRAALYRFNPDWSGDFIAESVSSGWVKLVGTEVGTGIKDTHLVESQGGRYRNKESLAVEDIYTAGHDPCHVGLLEQFEARAYVLVPVFVGQQLWGILAVYQNSGPRYWDTADVALLNQLAGQVGVALEQVKSLEQLRVQSEQLTNAATREKAAKEQLQQRVIQLLAAVQPVFSGDLTVRVPITEDEVGTIADAYNNTIQSLRKIVSQVQSVAGKMTETSQNSGAAIGKLSHQAEEQLHEVTRALDQIQGMVVSTQAVANNAQQVEIAVQQANQTVRAGDAAMNRTVESILAIRETVAETSKKIKRLSESSQKISKVVSLIGNFTTQTQLLALNASIEATRAGEYGRGFSVVADEVRSLARQSADATREIEKLVQDIQSETGAVSTAMDVGIQQVVGGTNLVNDTRQQLNEIVAATAKISQLVQGITQATLAQTEQSHLVTQAMTDVATLATKNSAQSSQISTSFQDLMVTARQLQTSVGQFKVN
jgi:methyl-accepting chemotaxis protein PixJ